METLNEDFRAFIGLLESEGVDYLIVGGYSIAVHGFPRYTGDINFFVAVSEDNADRLLRVYDLFGLDDIGFAREDFLTESFVAEIGREPRKIQVLTGIDGVTFSECIEHAIEVSIDGQTMKFIGKKDLLMNKQASGRPKDLIDLAELRKLPE